MAMPAYVLVYVLLGQYEPPAAIEPVRGLRMPGIYAGRPAHRDANAVLYPYVYVLARSAFLVSRAKPSRRPAHWAGYGPAVRGPPSRWPVPR